MPAPQGNKNALGNPGGARPTLYNKRFVKVAQDLCYRGATDGEIANALDVDRYTLVNWRAKYPDFAEAFKLGREPADERVVRSAYERAVGYTYDSEKIVVVDKKVERVPIKEHVPPDVTAQQYWLNNRRRSEWRNRQEVEVGGPGDFDRMSDDELRRFIDAEAATVVSPDRPQLEAQKGIAPQRSAAARSRAKKSDLFD